MKKSTVAALIVFLIAIPATLLLGRGLSGRSYYISGTLVMVEALIPFIMAFEGRKPQARELVVVAVMCALAVAARAAIPIPHFKPMFAIIILSGFAFGPETGFLVGAVTMLVSNILFSQGAWTPFQMFCMGIIGFLAGVLFRKGLLRRSRGALCIFGALCALIIYGGLMNPVAALLARQELNWQTLVAYYITGFPVDCVHAAATCFFLLVLAEPMLEKLDRIKVKYGIVE